MRHLQWEREGRTLGLSAGQCAYTGQIAQRNLELEDGSFVPYIWSTDARRLTYGDVEACFVRDRIEFRRDGVLQATTRPRLQRRTARGWRDEDARVRVERLSDEDDFGPIASARVAIVLESERATARHILVAGGWSRARGDTELRAHLPGEYRVVVDHDLGGAPVAPDRSVGAVGHVSALGWRVAWTAEEDRERTVQVTDRGLSIAMPALRRARGQRRPATQWISPDTYGPATNAGGDNDGLSRPSATSPNYKPTGLTGFGALYDGGFFIDDTSTDADQGGPFWRFASVNLGGTPTSIDSGTQISLGRPGTMDVGTGSGANGVVRFRCEATNTPADGATGSRPALRTYNSSANDHTFPTASGTQTPSLQTAIGGLRTAGYSYTGSSSHAILIQAGANTLYGITSVSFRLIGVDATHSSALPAVLTIVYTPGAPPPITGTLTATLAAATLAAAGVAPVVGTSAVTLGAATLSSTGVVADPGGGFLSQTLAAATLASTGTSTITGASAATLAASTLSSTGAVLGVGSLTATLAAATLDAHDTPPVTLDIGVGAAEQELNAVSHGGSFTKSTPSTDLTVSSISSNTITTASNTMKTGDGPYRFETTGTLPTGLATGTDYYIIRISATTYRVATGSAANALAGTNVTITGSGTGTHTLVRTVDTQASGSAFLCMVLRGLWSSAPSATPTDNKSNTYTLLGSIHNYAGFPASATGLYHILNGAGGVDHAWSAQAADFDELTVSAIEVKGGSVIKGPSYVERAIGSSSITSASVTATANAVLVAICCGNGPVGNDNTFTPTGGFTKLPAASREGDMSPNGYIQITWSRRDVGPGTYTATWNTLNNQGGQLYLLAIQDREGTSGTLTATLAAATLSATGVGARTGTVSQTLAAATLTATAVAPAVGSLSATLAAATLSATGTSIIVGAVTATLGAATVAATGAAPVVGALTATLAAATAAVTGTSTITGSLLTTLAASTLASTGTVSSAGSVTGSLAVTLAAATLSSSAVAPVLGSLAATLAPATLVSSAVGGTVGELAVTLAPAVLSASAVAPIRGSVAVTLGPATLASTGSVPVVGVLSVTLGAATLVAGNTVNDSLPPDDTVTIEPTTTMDIVSVESLDTIDYVTIEAA